jgi:GPH family glycoside/pentoside/hexuronide:cation symporter
MTNNITKAAPKAPLICKIGYGLGDMSSSMFWKIFTAYLPFFYSTVFGLSLMDATFLMLITRIWDAVSDPLMGIIADRTQTKWGKYRPYLMWIAVPFAVAGILLFTTPDMGYEGKRIWAYVTYILMMTVYTAINVPYGAMLGVMTADSHEKTVFSSFRMFFAYAGSFIVLAGWEPLCKLFNNMQGIDSSANDPKSWQYAMIVVGICCFILFILTFLMTRETVKSVKKESSVGSDLKTLFKNSPWWILLGGVLFFNLFSAVRYTAGPFFFASVIGEEAHLQIFSMEFLFYAGIFFAVGEVSNMLGVAMTPFISSKLGKKNTFMYSLILMIILSCAFFFAPLTANGYWIMMGLQVLISILTGIGSPLVWSMYADVADYAEHKFNTASTGLIFSSSSMAQKFGGAIGGAAVTAILAAVGFNTNTIDETKTKEYFQRDNVMQVACQMSQADSTCQVKDLEAYPALMTLDEVESLFSEYGVGKEAFQPEVLKTYAIHHETGEIISDELAADIAKERAGQSESALLWVRALMSFVPAFAAALSLLFILIYPLTTKRMREIQSALEIRRTAK